MGLVTAVPVAAQDGPPDAVVFPFELGGKTVTPDDYIAEWDEVTVHDGSSSVHLQTTGTVGDGDEARILIDLSDIPEEEEVTLGDIESISWWEYLEAGYPPHLDISLDFDDDGVRDDILVFEYAYNDEYHYTDESPMPYGAVTDAWYPTFDDDDHGPTEIDDSANAWLGSGPPGPLGGEEFIYGTLAEWKAGEVDPSVDADTVVLALEIEVDNWGVQSEAYVDDITINDMLICGKIQDAIDSVDSFIYVMPGTYYETITIDKQLTLISSDGAEETTIDGEAEDVVTITADGVIFGGSGFTVTNGECGIFLDAANNCQILGNIVTENTVGIVGDLYGEAIAYSLLIEGNEITDNSEGGIACFVDKSLDIDIIENTIDSNGCSGYSDGPGGDIRLHGNDNTVSIITADIVGNIMVEPSTGYSGGHVRVGWAQDEATTLRSYVTLTNNDMDGGGSGPLKLNAVDYLEATATGNEFLNNEWCCSKIGYSGPYTDDAIVKDLKATFIDNVFSMSPDVEWNYGILKILAEESIEATIIDNEFLDSDAGGALRIGKVCSQEDTVVTEDVIAEIGGNTFTDNHGGAIWTGALENLDVEIYDNVIDGTGCEWDGGDRSAVEVVVGGSTINADIYGNTIANFDNAGIYVEAPATGAVNIYDNEITDGDYGIYLTAFDGATITGNTIRYVWEGIDLEDSDLNEVSGNEISYVSMIGAYGIRLEDSNYNTINSNTIIDVDGLGAYGIYLYDSDNNTIGSNTVTDIDGATGHGICLLGVSMEDEITGNVVTGNTISDVSSDGVYMTYAEANFVLNNDISLFGNNGVYIGDKCHNVIAGNTISNVLFEGTADGGTTTTLVDGALTQEDGYWNGDILYMVSGPNAGQSRLIVDFVAATDTLTVNPAFDQTISQGEEYVIYGGHGIYLEYGDGDTIGAATVDEVPVPGNTISWVGWGIYLSSSDNVSVLDNEVTLCYYQGIWLDVGCDTNTVAGNSVSHSQWGIYLGTCFTDNTVSGNTVCCNEYGIYLYDTDYETVSENIVCHNEYGIYLWLSYYNDILDNVVCANTEVGITLDGPGEGESDNNTVSGNVISSNGDGIWMDYAHYNTITGNEITGNWSLEEEPETGIHLTANASSNEIHENNIMWNTFVMGGMVPSYGLYDGNAGNNDATWNYWGDASGPYNETWNWLGTGDSAEGEWVDGGWFDSIVPWASEAYPFDPVVADVADPDITATAAVPDMLSVFSWYWSEPEPGPQETNLVVEASDDICVGRVYLNFKEMYYQLFPFLEEFTPPPEWSEDLNGITKLEMWEMMMGEYGYLEYIPLEYDCGCGIWQLHSESFSGVLPLNFVFGMLMDFFGPEEVLGWIGEEMEMGNISIPVTAYDCFGKEGIGTIELGIVSWQTRLKEGWNLRSTPITLTNNTWGEITSLGDGLDFDTALSYDPVAGWSVMTATDTLDPLEAIYIYSNSDFQTLGFAFATGTTPVPARDLKAGWSLIGLAINPDQWDGKPSNLALTSIEQDDAGLRGYAQVVSPGQHIAGGTQNYYYGECDLGDSHGWTDFHQSDWVAFLEQPQVMRIWRGYWVFMEHADTLAGLSYTPLIYWGP